MTDDYFRARLDQMIDLRHPLAVLAQRLPWGQIEEALAPSFVRKNRKGKQLKGEDLFGTTLAIAGSGISHGYGSRNKSCEAGRIGADHR